MKNIKFFLIASTFLFFSCIKEVTYNGNFGTPKLVVNALQVVDSNFVVYLGKSRFFLASRSESYIMDDAEIILKNLNTGEIYTVNQPTNTNSSSSSNQMYEGKKYEYPCVVTPNTRYSLEVNHPDFPKLSTQTKTPSKVDIIRASIENITRNSEEITIVKLTFKDPEETNFYGVKASYQSVYTISYNSNNNTNGDTTLYRSSLGIRFVDGTEATNTNVNIDGSINPEEVLFFTDKNFNSEEKTISFELTYWDSNLESLEISLSSMNEDAYKYALSVYLQSDFEIGFSEPVKIYTNIINGFGIFGGMSVSVFKP